MNLKFSATSLDECLEKASSELNISKEFLKYKVTKEEKKFFKKRVEIEVLDEKKDTEIKLDIKEFTKNIGEEKETFGAKVEDGKIIIKDSPKKDEIITIKPCSGVILLINSNKIEEITPITSEDKIEYKFEEAKPVKSVEISISDDKMEAYINMKSVPQHIYELADQEYQRNLTLVKKKIDEKYPLKYTLKELKESLKSNGICYGIIEEELSAICNEYQVNNRLVARGLPVYDDIPDEIQTLFKESEELIKYNDLDQKVDYRKKYLISNVSIGDVIGKIIPAKSGSDGKDVLGVPVKRKTSKKIPLKIGQGCKMENNNIIATIEGKPEFKANTFNVNKLYKVDAVDLKSGNIDFVGNVEVVGAVSEGMEVKAGNELLVGNNVESAKIRTGGEVCVGGNVLHSIITAGSENVERRQYLDSLINLKTIINELVLSTEQVKENSLLGPRQDGEIIKILIENKYKLMPKLSKSILNYNMHQGVQKSEISAFIISKLLGLGPLKIKKFKELKKFEELLEEEIEEMEEFIVVPTDIYIQYAQSSTIEASGSVFITGKGQYTSKITALKNIEFTGENAVCRGGILCAGSEIKLKTVGSTAGVGTILKVSKNGRIKADIAYNNTIFCFGEKQVILEVSSKNVEAYLDEADEIIIDKFIL